MKKNENVLKLCLMGEGGVGKTTLCNRILTGLFNPTTKMTIGIDFQLLKVDILDPTTDEERMLSLEVQIWDFGGEDRFRFMLPRFVKGATGGLLLYDLSRFSTRRYLEEWYGIWSDNSKADAPLYLIGSKFDTVDEHQEEMVQEECNEIAASFGIDKSFLISSKSGYSVDVLVDNIVKDMYIFKKNQK